MRTIHVNATSEYDVLIGSGLLDSVGVHAKAIKNVQNVCIVSDSNVFPFYGKRVIDSLEQNQLHVVSFVFPAGECSKNADTYLNLLNFLAENSLSRNDLIIALGGGVVGDLAGFAAATYLRGIRYFQLPTTVLSASDSSVGGKTAIDLPAGKNLAGAFHHPALVLCDTDCLNTLPDRVFRDGCAELIKYGILFDEALFSHLFEYGSNFDRELVLSRCVELKRNVVTLDEFDNGVRRLLNLGHTVGHAIEKCSAFTVTHGEAVAAGMAIVARSAVHAGICEVTAMEQILSILNAFQLPVTTEYTAHDLAIFAVSDKKRSGSHINLILPERIGYCRVEPILTQNIQSFIEAGL